MDFERITLVPAEPDRSEARLGPDRRLNDLFLISRPPSEKFANRYALALHASELVARCDCHRVDLFQVNAKRKDYVVEVTRPSTILPPASVRG